MNEPILAREVELPPPVRPRLYVMVDPERTDMERYCTSYAFESMDRLLAEPNGDFDVPFALPGSAEAWTEERVREAALKWTTGNGWENGADTIDGFVAFARTLGVLPEVGP